MLEASQLLELAIEMERAGSRLYRSLAEEYGEDAGLKDMFTFLATEEEEHEVRLAEIKSRIADTSIPGFETFRPPRLQAFRSVFSPSRLADERARISDLATAVDFAVRREMDSVFLYHEISDVVPDGDRHHLAVLLEDEREHFRRLTTLRAGMGL